MISNGDVEEYLDNRHLFYTSQSPSSSKSLNSNDESLSLQEEIDGERLNKSNPEADNDMDTMKESLVKTLKVCLSEEEVDRIRKEYDRNMSKISSSAIKSKSDLDFSSILEEVSLEKCKEKDEKKATQMERVTHFRDVIDVDELEDSDEIDFKDKMEKNVVKPYPQFVKVLPESGEIDKSSSKSFLKTENTFMRSNKMEKIMRNLEKQKRKARNIDPNRKYFGFGETFNKDKNQLKQMRKEEKKQEKEKRKMDRMRTLKKATVSKEEKDLMSELLQAAENSVSDSATNSNDFKDEGVFMSEDIPSGRENSLLNSNLSNYHENLQEFDLIHTASRTSDHVGSADLNMEELDELFKL